MSRTLQIDPLLEHAARGQDRRRSWWEDGVKEEWEAGERLRKRCGLGPQKYL